MVGLSALEVNLGPILAVIGAAGFVIAFALQEMPFPFFERYVYFPSLGFAVLAAGLIAGLLQLLFQLPFLQALFPEKLLEMEFLRWRI